jgi:acetyltransferase-like isoleucine patch superfamily enzyme
MILPLETDHAFASGPVFRQPKKFFGALQATRDFRGARLLLAVWSQLFKGGRIAEGVMLGTNARLIDLGCQEDFVIAENAVVCGILRNETGGRIEIQRDAYVGDDVILSSALSIVVGNETLLANEVQVFDNETHPLDTEQRSKHFRMIRGMEAPQTVEFGAAPVAIGARCWIGMNSLIFKSVAIGDGTVVAGGSVVVDDIPSQVIAAGNPARPHEGSRNIPGGGLSIAEGKNGGSLHRGRPRG